MFLIPSLIHFTLAETHSEPQSWHQDDFKLNTFEIQLLLKKTFSEFPVSKSSNFSGNEATTNPFSGGVLWS